MDTQQVHDSGIDPADYVWPPTVAALLSDDSEIELDEQRQPESGAGADPAEDLALTARRLH